MTLEFLAEVRIEAAEAMAYREQSEGGLGERLGSGIENTAQAILGAASCLAFTSGGLPPGQSNELSVLPCLRGTR